VACDRRDSIWLQFPHRALGAAVLAAYGWPVDLTDDEILARLLAINLARAKEANAATINRTPTGT
jgi:hypothetical protein